MAYILNSLHKHTSQTCAAGHHSQTITKDTDYQLQIELKLPITHDFVMEILSYSETVKVLSPKILVDKI